MPERSRGSAKALLRQYFMRELESADADARRFVRSAHRRSRRIAPFAAIVVLAVVVAGSLTLTGLLRDSSSLRGDRQAPGIVMGPNGVPVSIDGRTVLQGANVQAAAESATDDTRFLVGGWIIIVHPDCEPYPPTVDVADVCGAGPFLSYAPMAGGLIPQDAHLSQIVLSRLPVLLDTNGPFVFEVHARDGLAAQCDPALRSACERALVADDLVWRSGE